MQIAAERQILGALQADQAGQQPGARVVEGESRGSRRSRRTAPTRPRTRCRSRAPGCSPRRRRSRSLRRSWACRSGEGRARPTSSAANPLGARNRAPARRLASSPPPVRSAPVQNASPGTGQDQDPVLWDSRRRHRRVFARASKRAGVSALRLSGRSSVIVARRRPGGWTVGWDRGGNCVVLMKSNIDVGFIKCNNGVGIY